MRFNYRLRRNATAWGGALAALVFAAGCQSSVDRAPAGAAAVETATPVKREQAAVPEPPQIQEPLTITWEDLDVGMPPDTLFEPWMAPTRVKALEGKRVRIVGYMSGAIFQKDHIREFPLMREKECPFGPGGQAHHVIEVELQGKVRTSFTTMPVTVEGVFGIQPRTGPNGNTWSLYRLDATKIE